MHAYKDDKKGTWYVSFHYFDWTGKNVRKMMRFLLLLAMFNFLFL